MREVPPGETATIKLANFTEWGIKETEYGMKYCIPVTLFSHPSYDSIPSKGLQCNWVSKSVAAKALFNWMFVEGEPSEGDVSEAQRAQERRLQRWRQRRAASSDEPETTEPETT